MTPRTIRSSRHPTMDAKNKGGSSMNEIAIGQRRSMQQTEVKVGTWTRPAAAVGVAGIVVSTIGYILHGDLPMGKSGAEIVKWATTTKQSTFTVGIYVEIVGYLLFLLFAAWLWA